jgi:hypothetical protein
MNNYDKELHAMKVCALALEKLTREERRRVLAWLEQATEDEYPNRRYSGMREIVE